ncbi:unnamed protein product [Calypogeia fissa]
MAEPRISRMLVLKWMGFVAAIWVQSISGNNYTFANYSADLKTVMNYNQQQLNALGVAKDVGKSVGLLAGYLSDFLPAQVILLIGAAVGVLGYGTTWLVVSERIAPPSFWQMCIIVFMGGNSSTWMNTAVLVTCMRNFAQKRGPVSGILKGFVGLSTAIFTVLCSALFTGNSSAFLLLLAGLPAVICLVAALFLREIPLLSGAGGVDREEHTSFTILNVISLSLSLYLLAYTFTGGSFSPLVSKLFAVGLLLFVLSPIVVPARLVLSNWLSGSSDDLKKTEGKKVDEVREPLLPNSSDVERRQRKEQVIVAAAVTERTTTTLTGGAGSSGDVAVYTRPKLGENFTVLEILATVDFWALFLTFLSAVGTGMAVINNMGQIGESLGHPDVATYVSFISIFGFFGRIGAGTVSEYFVRSAALPRPVWMAGSKVFMVLGYLALGWGISGSLSFGSIVVGICYGVHMTIVVATASEMFGLKSFGMTYNILVLNIPLGSFLFSLLAGYLYDKESQDSSPLTYLSKLLNMSSLSDEATTCYGAHCYRTLFIFMSGVLAVGLVLDLILIIRLRPVFQRLYGSSSNSRAETERRK